MWSQLFLLPIQEFCRFDWDWLWSRQGETQQLLIKVQHTHILNRFHKTFFHPFLLTIPRGLSQSEVRCFMDGKCVFWDRIWPAGSLRELQALLWVSRVLSEWCHCLVTLSWAFYQQAQKQKPRTPLCPNTNPAPVHKDLNQRHANCCSYPTTHRCLLPVPVLFHPKVSKLHWGWSPQAHNQCSSCSQ